MPELSLLPSELPALSWRMLISSAIVLLATWVAMYWKRHFIQSLIARDRSGKAVFERGKVDAINKAATLAILITAGFFLLGVTNHNINALIAFGGIGGLALAFASQQIIANFFSGMMIYLTQPFSIGDAILLPDRAIEGIVEEIGWYMTRILSPDKRPIYIPNSLFSSLIVITSSRMSHHLIKESFYVSSEDLTNTLPKIKELLKDLQQLLLHHSGLDHNLPQLASLIGLHNAAFEIQLQAYVAKTSGETFLAIKENLLLKVAELMQKYDLKLQTVKEVA